MHGERISCLQKYKSILSYILIAAGATIPGLYFLVRGYSLVWRDTAKLFQPIRFLVDDALGSFHLPLWNPHEALGVPLFAQMMHGVLHPVSLLSAYLFPHSSLDPHIIIYTALAAIGGALLARTLGVSRGAAAVAGLGYALSGYVLGMGSIIQYLCASATAPWAVAGMRAAGEGRRFAISAASFAVACLFFAGDPQMAVVALLLGSALATEAGGWRGLGKAATAVTLGTVIASVQLLPTMYYLLGTSRGVEIDMFDRLQWALSPWRLIEFLVPGFFGSPATGLERWPVFIWLGGLARSGFEMPFSPSVYMGSGLLVLALAGITGSRASRVLGVSALVLLWIALGANAGAEQLMHHIPVWGKFRYSEKMVGPLTLCISLLAAFGADRLAERPGRSWSTFAACGGVLSLLTALFLANWHGSGTIFTAGAAREAAPIACHNLAVGFGHAGLTLLALAALITGCSRRPELRIYFPAAAAFLIFLQSSAASPFAMHAGSRHARDEFPLLQIRSDGEPTRILTPLEKNIVYPRELDDFDGQIAMQSHMGFPAYNVTSGIDQFDTYTGLTPRRLEVLTRAFSENFGINSVLALRRYAITHAIIKNPYFADEVAVAGAASQGGVKVLESPRWGFIGWRIPHRPWATFADKVVVAQDEKGALDTLIGTMARGEATVVLENAPLPKSLGNGQVLRVERNSENLRIEANSADDCVLVVNDSYWPGWRASIDGNEVPLWRADFLVRAVPWPKGRHLLEMRYEPEEVRIGKLASLAGIAMLFALLILEWRRPGKPGQRFSGVSE